MNSYWIQYLTFLLVLFTLVSPYIFTRNSIFADLDFRETGQIGDTIGGLTAPILGLLNAILLYKSITQTNKTIKLQIISERNQIRPRFRVMLSEGVEWDSAVEAQPVTLVNFSDNDAIDLIIRGRNTDNIKILGLGASSEGMKPLMHAKTGLNLTYNMIPFNAQQSLEIAQSSNPDLAAEKMMVVYELEYEDVNGYSYKQMVSWIHLHYDFVMTKPEFL